MREIKRDLQKETLDIIATYMDDDVREQVHSELAPCEPAEFLARYYELDPTFEEFVESEFGFCLFD